MAPDNSLTLPYWRISSFYFFYFAALGAFLPYWGLYLASLGFSAIEIGELMAIVMATKVVAPYLWGWLGDHLNRRMAIVRTGSLLTFLTFGTVFWLHGFWGLALAMAVFSFFWNAVLPQLEVVTFAHLDQEAPKYARLRVWGSVGFLLTVVLLGPAVDAEGPRVALYALFGIYGGIWIASLLVPEREDEVHHAAHEPLRRVLTKPHILGLFLVCFLLQAGHGAYYTFYSIFLDEIGYSKTAIGQLWALGVVAEVILYVFFMHRLLELFGTRAILLASLMLAAGRWLLIGFFPESLAVLAFAQLLHAASFGSFHAAAIHLVYVFFPGRLRGRGQALYSSVSFGAGGAIGSLASGIGWDTIGPTLTFAFSSLVTVVAVVVAQRLIKNP
ncbi:MAG: MFS transporter [Pseudomonadota bacterium]